MQKNLLIILALVAVLAVGAFVAKKGDKITDNITNPPPPGTTPTPTTPITPPPTPVTPNISLPLAASTSINGVMITPVSIVQDSRCAEGVQCIWAGTVVVKSKLTYNSVSETKDMELGKSTTFGTKEVTLVSVTPYPKNNQTIKSGDYRFAYSVKDQEVGKCYVGGCSGQICSDEEGVASTCEYQPAYSCYRGAQCRRQENGKCGWTETMSLRACLMNPPMVD